LFACNKLHLAATEVNTHLLVFVWRYTWGSYPAVRCTQWRSVNSDQKREPGRLNHTVRYAKAKRFVLLREASSCFTFLQPQTAGYRMRWLFT